MRVTRLRGRGVARDEALLARLRARDLRDGAAGRKAAAERGESVRPAELELVLLARFLHLERRERVQLLDLQRRLVRCLRGAAAAYPASQSVQASGHRV